MPITYSPLRYPGGKTSLSNFLADLITINSLKDGVYAEPFCGGAGASLKLLYGEYVQKVILNDADKCIYALWNTILTKTKAFIKLIQETPVTIGEWYHQRQIYNNYRRYSEIRVAFATFFLNRCNRSGILTKAGPIGGKEQNGYWKINARYNKEDLIRRIEKIACYSDRIAIYNLDAIDFLRNVLAIQENVNHMLVYLDPPYYVKGSELYLNHYQHNDHLNLSNYLHKKLPFKWIMSYDNVSEIRNLYSHYSIRNLLLHYTANKSKIGNEILIYDENLIVPEDTTTMIN